MHAGREHDYFKAILDAMPSPVFVVDEDVRIVEFNRAAAPLLEQNPEVALKLRAGEALHCLHSTDSRLGCGRGPFCRTCVIRTSVANSLNGQTVSRRALKMELVRGRSVREHHVLVTTAPFRYADQDYVLMILEDVSELMELRRVIPICANCKRIRNDQEYWEQVEAYFKSRLDLDFSHGICPDCFERLYPDLYSKLPEEEKTRAKRLSPDLKGAFPKVRNPRRVRPS